MFLIAFKILDIKPRLTYLLVVINVYKFLTLIQKRNITIKPHVGTSFKGKTREKVANFLLAMVFGHFRYILAINVFFVI